VGMTQAVLGLLPDLGSEKLPQARGHRLSVMRQALRGSVAKPSEIGLNGLTVCLEGEAPP